jgi:iron complex outermembrane receptor protein
MHRRASIRTAVACLALGVGGAAASGAQDTTVAHRLPPVVTVTRDVARSPLELPYAITIIRPDSARPGQPHTRIDETLFLIPGVTVANRNNPSQDARVSIRGFGARSAFGVRSIRVLRDGMPLTLPDGQTPIDYLDLESVDRIEAIRGTASALYGNASGGVIDLRSGPAPLVPLAVQARSWSGSDKLQRYAGLFGGTLGDASYLGNVGYTASDNFRDFSHQRLTNGYGQLRFAVGGTDYAIQALGLDMPLAESPGALTQAQVNSSPWIADPVSVLKRARKEVRQLQLGMSARRPILGDGELFAQAYGGTRSLYNPLTFAVVDVGRHQYGGSVRAAASARLLNVDNRVSVGVDFQQQDDLRRNFANCNGVARTNASCPALPAEEGALTLDQREIVSGTGPYVRDELAIGRALRVSLGVRADVVRFELRDHFLSDNRDDSGVRTLNAVSPMLGVLARVTPLHALYANISSAFETPTTTELGNQPNGSAGLNLDLRPQFSTTYETGMKGLATFALRYDVAFFDTEVRDELIPFQIPGGNGRTYYRNAGRTRRVGAELGANSELGPLELGAAYTLSHFRFREFRVDTSQYDGRSIPGIPEQQLEGSATLRYANAFTTFEAMAKSSVFVNDANTATAAGFSVFNLRFGGTAAFGRPWLSPVIGVNNLFDRKYVGSVAVNATGATLAQTKFYEPAPGRTWFAGLTVATGR